MPWVPEPYQLEGVEFLLGQPEGALLLDPGLRKTSIVLAAFKILRGEGLVNKLLVVSTPRICGMSGPWHGEVKKWAEFNHFKVATIHGVGRKKDRALESDADIYLVSYEGLDWLLDVEKWKGRSGKTQIKPNFHRVKALGVDMLALDEASKVRKATSQRSKLVVAARQYFQRVVTMTGSPTPRSMEDLFGVMLVTDGGYSLGQFITHYRNAYFYPSGYGGYSWKLQEGGEEKIYAKVAPFVFRLDTKKLIHIPELIENPVAIDLPDEARRVYDELEEEFISEVERKGLAAALLLAQNSGALWVKLAQVANGGIFMQGAEGIDLHRKAVKKEWLDLHEEKLIATEDILEELNGSPALIVYDFAHDLARLKGRLGKDFPSVEGGMTMKTVDKLVDAWNAGDLPGLLVHPASMSHGLNMQERSASHIIWHSMTTNYEWYDQLTRRLRRSGNVSKHVTNHLLVAKDTVDEAKLASLRLKRGNQDRFFVAMQEYTAKRTAARKAEARTAAKQRKLQR